MRLIQRFCRVRYSEGNMLSSYRSTTPCCRLEHSHGNAAIAFTRYLDCLYSCKYVHKQEGMNLVKNLKRLFYSRPVTCWNLKLES